MPIIAYWSRRIALMPSAPAASRNSGLSGYTFTFSEVSGCITGIWVDSCPTALTVTCRVIGSPAGRAPGSRDQSSVSETNLAGNHTASG